MPSTQGKSGKVRIATNAVVKVRNWSLDIERDQLDDSELGTEWREFLQGIGQWSGSFESAIDPADTNGQLALINAVINGTTTNTLNLLTDDTPSSGSKKGFTGNANISSLGVGVDFESIEEGSYSFQGDGAITYSETIT